MTQVFSWTLGFPANLKLAVNSMAAHDELGRMRLMQIRIVRWRVLGHLLPNVKVDGRWR